MWMAAQAAVVSVRNWLDVTTLAWADFAAPKALDSPHGLDTPLYVRAAIDGFEGELFATGATYAQPAPALARRSRWA